MNKIIKYKVHITMKINRIRVSTLGNKINLISFFLLPCFVFLSGCSQAPSVTRAKEPNEKSSTLSHAETQLKSNSFLWDDPRWGPRPIKLKENDITVLNGYNARVTGNVKLTSAEDVEPRKVPYGFLQSEDALIWTVNVPSSGKYQVAVMYHPGDEENYGSTITVSTAGSKVKGLTQPIHEKKWIGGPPDRPSFRRTWLKGELELQAGNNEISLNVHVTSGQTARAKLDLENSVIGWPKHSLHINMIELARAEVLASQKADAALLRSSTEWMVDGGYGLFIHWVPESFPFMGSIPAWQRYEEAVNEFDVKAFADMVNETGAAWVVFTTTHGKYFFPGPLKTLEDLVPGRTTRRDLVCEISTALAKYNIRLMLYFHPGPSKAEDEQWATVAGIDPADDEKNMKIMLAIFAEIGEKYRNKLAGWVIDGGGDYYRRNYSFKELMQTLKVGNDERVVSFFNWLYPKLSVYGGDFTTDLTNFGAPLAPPYPVEWSMPGGFYDGLQPHFNFTLEDVWYPDKPMNGKWPALLYSNSELADYMTEMKIRRVPITLNLVITQDVTKDRPFVNPVSLQQLKYVHDATRRM
jgi:glycosyltransferase involved in cell wall biosynthesis